jgi:UPF0716 protein FxsA
VNPFWLLLSLLVGLPLVELYLLIQVGSVIGAVPTIALSVFTAVLGGLLMRQQGLATALRVQASLARGESPAIEMLEGVVIFLAGAVLMFPGFLSDVLGLLLLFPPLRRVLLHYGLRRWQLIHPVPRDARPGAVRQGYIEGEFRREK